MWSNLLKIGLVAVVLIPVGPAEGASGAPPDLAPSAGAEAVTVLASDLFSLPGDTSSCRLASPIRESPSAAIDEPGPFLPAPGEAAEAAGARFLGGTECGYCDPNHPNCYLACWCYCDNETCACMASCGGDQFCQFQCRQYSQSCSQACSVYCGQGP